MEKQEINQEIEDKLVQLLKEYVACANYSLGLLKELYNGNESFLYAYKVLKIIPKEGYIDNVYYNFHGRGCFFKYPNDSIDIDFSNDGSKVNGFDLYRVEKFLLSRLEKYPVFKDKKLLSMAFLSLANKGIIKKDLLYPNDHLYFLDNFN